MKIDISQITSENQQLNKIKQMKKINYNTDTNIILRPLRNCIHNKRSPDILIERTTINNKFESKGVLKRFNSTFIFFSESSSYFILH